MRTGAYGQTFPIATPQHPSNRVSTIIILEHSLPQIGMTAQVAEQISKNIAHALGDSIPSVITKRVVVELIKGCVHSLTTKDKEILLKGMNTLLTATNTTPTTEPLAQDPLFLKWITEQMGPEFTDPTSKEAWLALKKRWIEGAGRNG